MHLTAFLSTLLLFEFLNDIIPNNNNNNKVIKIMDLGSFDVNGNTRDAIKESSFHNNKEYNYLGIDMTISVSINQSNYQSIYQSIYLSIYLSI
jgi:hypothetical protein